MFRVTSLNDIPIDEIEYIDVHRSKYPAKLQVIICMSHSLYTCKLVIVLDDEHQETIDALVKINDVEIYNKKQGTQLFHTMLFSEALDDALEDESITKIEIQNIATSSSAVWNEIINKIIAYIDPEIGVRHLELIFNGQQTEDLDSNVFNSLIPLCSNLHTLIIGGTITLPEDARCVVLFLVQSLAQILKDSLKKL